MAEEAPMLPSDYSACLILLLLYTLQGVPMGLSASVPILLRDLDVSYTDLGTFALCSWPFAIKLLWAPIVDSVYNPKWGRRKTWFVPTQLVAGALFIWAGMPENVDTMMGANGAAPDIPMLTATFFMMYFLMATQDIAVDGWALTMLSPPHVEKGSTVNSVGQNLGFFLGFIGFLGLNDPKICNQYLRAEPSGEPLATLGGFLTFFGWALLITTVSVAIFRPEADDGHADQEMSLVDTYATVWKVLKLPAVQRLALMMLTCRAAFACADNVTNMKMIEYGMDKTSVAFTTSALLPLAMAVPILTAKLLPNTHALDVFMGAFVVRLTLGFFDPIMLNYVKTDIDMAWKMWIVMAVVWVTVGAMMFTAQMEFFAKISDPMIGGTYMTLLNTVANLGNTWPKNIALRLVDVLTVKEPLPLDEAAVDAGSDAEPEYRTVTDGFFKLNQLCLVVGILWLVIMWRMVTQLRDEPLSSWTVVSSGAAPAVTAKTTPAKKSGGKRAAAQKSRSPSPAPRPAGRSSSKKSQPATMASTRQRRVSKSPAKFNPEDSTATTYY